MRVFVNRRPFTGDPRTISLHNHTDIIINIGPPHRSRWTRSFPDHVVTSNPCRSRAAVALMRDETLHSRRIGKSIAVCITDLRHHYRQHELGLRP